MERFYEGRPRPQSDALPPLAPKRDAYVKSLLAINFLQLELESLSIKANDT